MACPHHPRSAEPQRYISFDQSLRRVNRSTVQSELEKDPCSGIAKANPMARLDIPNLSSALAKPMMLMEPVEGPVGKGVGFPFTLPVATELHVVNS